MIKDTIHDPIFLAGKSEIATKEDLQVAQDLLDTLIANKEGCVGMAANIRGSNEPSRHACMDIWRLPRLSA